MTTHARAMRGPQPSRRQFLATGTAGGLALMTGSSRSAETAAGHADTRPNFLFITTDQQGLDTLSAYGCPGIHTPNLDRLARRGVSFMESYCTNPVCSPARSSLFTGRTTCETSVIGNGTGIRPDIPNLGQWLGREGYETVYCGKWHVPHSYPREIPGFTVLPGGLGGQGTLGDQAVSSACEGYLFNRSREKPFLLVASFLQPHDICNWNGRHANPPTALPYAEVADQLPPLPANFGFDPKEPTSARVPRGPAGTWHAEQWRYYLWSYYRMVEEADHEIGRVLDALEHSGQAENTIIVFTSDHGEGRGRHQSVTKNFLYDEATRVPLILSCPGRIAAGKTDTTHLVSGLDIMATLCEYAGVAAPPNNRGYSLRPLAEGTATEWREFVVAEVRNDTGRMIRTPHGKLIAYRDDPVQQYFDMRNDPGETRNLIDDAAFASAIRDHRRLLNEWESRLDHAPNALPAFRVELT